MEVQVFHDAGTGHGAEVESDIEALRFHQPADGVLATSGKEQEIAQFLLSQVV